MSCIKGKTMKITNEKLLQLLQVASWVIFLGLCIETGGILFNTIYAVFNPIVAKHFWNGVDLSALYAYDKGQFVVQATLMLIVATMKTIIFYVIVKVFYDKKFNLARPFNPSSTKMIFHIGYLCLGAGIFSIWALRNVQWLEGKGIPMPALQDLRAGGADVWLFMAVVLIVIGQVFKKGMELQEETELTV